MTSQVFIISIFFALYNQSIKQYNNILKLCMRVFLFSIINM